MNPVDPHFLAPPGPDLLRTPWHRVIGVLPGLDEAASSILELSDVGFARDEIHAICGEAGARRLDPAGKRHGLHGRLIRTLRNVTAADDTLFADADDLASGAVIVSVPARDNDMRSRAAHVLREHGATNLRYFGTAGITDLG